MRSVKVSEATGSVLDWLVAKACYPDEEINLSLGFPYLQFGRFNPTSDWRHGGPIIECEEISTWFHADYGCWCAAGIDWMSADVSSDEFMAMPDAFRGPTPLIAAMRCLVASKLGDEVEVPDGLAS